MNEYVNLDFRKINKKWYVQLAGHEVNDQELQLVEGADKLCQYFSDRCQNPTCAEVTVVASNELQYRVSLEGFIKLERTDTQFEDGAEYRVADNEDCGVETLWMSGVLRDVFGSYPRYIYVTERTHPNDEEYIESKKRQQERQMQTEMPFAQKHITDLLARLNVPMSIDPDTLFCRFANGGHEYGLACNSNDPNYFVLRSMVHSIQPGQELYVNGLVNHVNSTYKFVRLFVHNNDVVLMCDGLLYRKEDAEHIIGRCFAAINDVVAFFNAEMQKFYAQQNSFSQPQDNRIRVQGFQ